MPSNDSTYLQELINDFPCKRKTSIEKAELWLQERYRVFELGEFIPTVFEILNDPSRIRITNDPSINPLFDLFNQGEIYPLFFYNLSKSIHKYLFSKILSNAGNFRSSSEINSGFIGFGGPNRRALGNLKFHGSTPEKITLNLINAFCHLKKKSNDPLRDGLLFYRKFVRTHPFYDGNGRIGRLILKIYLRIFHLEIQWDKINNEKLMKKMNECHLREDKEKEYEKYFGFLYDFIKKAIARVNEEDINDFRFPENY
jgi:fido (protein-threonine AMPylation protein)